MGRHKTKHSSDSSGSDRSSHSSSRKRTYSSKSSGSESRHTKMNKHRLSESESQMSTLFGFDWSDFASTDNFFKLMNRPCDPSNLALFRILFGE